jgi:hypothetical protein
MFLGFFPSVFYDFAELEGQGVADACRYAVRKGGAASVRPLSLRSCTSEPLRLRDVDLAHY